MTAQTEQLDTLLNALQRAVAGAEYLSKPFFGAQIIAGCQEAVVRTNSPWLTRADAAAYWRCSTTEIDKAARAGILTKKMRAGTPMFLKSEGDEKIAQGKWTKELLEARLKEAA